MNHIYKDMMIRDYDEPGAFSPIIIKYIPPEITWTKTANYSQIEILSRYAPVPVYTSGGPKTMSLSLDFFAEQDVQTEIKDIITILESFLYGDRIGNLYLSPHRLYFTWGNVLNFIAIVTSVSPTYRSPIEITTGIPYYVTVTLELQEARNTDEFEDLRSIRSNIGR